jgi:hypothetical protein
MVELPCSNTFGSLIPFVVVVFIVIVLVMVLALPTYIVVSFGLGRMCRLHGGWVRSLGSIDWWNAYDDDGNDDDE